jgi:hypothetical protein
MRDHSNVKFIWYEEMIKDQKKVIGELCSFLDHPLSSESIDKLIKITSIDSMRKTTMDKEVDDKSKERVKMHFRKGVIGNWKEYFAGENLVTWNKWVQDNLKDTDIKMAFS